MDFIVSGILHCLDNVQSHLTCDIMFHLRNIKRWRKIWTNWIKYNHMRSITDILRPSVGNQNFLRYLIFMIKYQKHIEMTSVTAGLDSADLVLHKMVCLLIVKICSWYNMELSNPEINYIITWRHTSQTDYSSFCFLSDKVDDVIIHYLIYLFTHPVSAKCSFICFVLEHKVRKKVERNAVIVTPLLLLSQGTCTISSTIRVDCRIKFQVSLCTISHICTNPMTVNHLFLKIWF